MIYPPFSKKHPRLILGGDISSYLNRCIIESCARFERNVLQSYPLQYCCLPEDH